MGGIQARVLIVALVLDLSSSMSSAHEQISTQSTCTAPHTWRSVGVLCALAAMCGLVVVTSGGRHTVNTTHTISDTTECLTRTGETCLLFCTAHNSECVKPSTFRRGHCVCSAGRCKKPWGLGKNSYECRALFDWEK